jgi:hypothetical protein
MTTSREDIISGYAAFFTLADFPGSVGEAKFKRHPRCAELCSIWPSYFRKDETPYTVLSRLEPGALEVYFALVDRYHGRKEANEAILRHARVQWPDGVTVHVENSDSDPFRVDFHAFGDIASDWADVHGALDGGTWENDEGMIYDSGYWHKDLFDNLRKEGFKLDLSSWNDPDEGDHAAARHASNCEECQEHWDWDRIREHMKEPLVEVAREIISREVGWEGSF